MNVHQLKITNKWIVISLFSIATWKTVKYKNLEIQFLPLIVGKSQTRLRISNFHSLLYLLNSLQLVMAMNQFEKLDLLANTTVVESFAQSKIALNAKGLVDRTPVKTVYNVWKWTFKKEAWKKDFLSMVTVKFLGCKMVVSHVALDAKMELIIVG